MEIEEFSKPILPIKKGDILCSTFSQYNVLEILGHGSFGQVIKCQNMSTNSTMAVKILLDAQAVTQAEEEVNMLRQINSLNHPNLLKFFENFQYQGYRCMVFEMLHKDLHNTIVSEDLEMQLTEIRAIARQLFSALDALSDAGILHTDIKSDNIMFVGKGDLKVKLIDFGLAFYDGDAPTGTIMQPVSYRSPEILLGLPFSHGIDMWATGCLLVFLYLQHHLFRETSSYGMMRQIVQLLGQPDDRLLSAGKYTKKYFVHMDASQGSAWRLKTPDEYAADIGAEGDQNVKDSVLKSLDDLVDVFEFVSLAEKEDRLQFVDLVKSMLNLDGTKRISAFQASTHSFIMMSHLSDPRDKAYLEDSEEKMSCCYKVDSEDEQQCEEESDEDRQVCEEFEDGEEEPEHRGWAQPIDYKREQSSASDWEQTSVSDCEQTSVSDRKQPIDYKREQSSASDWEQTSVSDCEQTSDSDREQPVDYKLEQPNVSDWERSDDSGRDETDSIDLDFENKECVYVPEATTPSLGKEHSRSEIIAQAVSGLAGMTCPPSASMEIPDSSTKKSAWNTFTKTLQTFWRNIKPFFCCFC